MSRVSLPAKLVFSLVLLFCIWIFTASVRSLASAPRTMKMWPELSKDLTKIYWAHAVNNQEYLERVLKDDKIHMLEADISLGTLTNDPPGTKPRPIMAHPPETVSDLSLEHFLDQVIQAVKNGSRKGMKLDFKTIDVVEDSLKSVHYKEPLMPVWINADILPGPGQPTATPLPHAQFLALAQRWTPRRTLSLGFTTGMSGSPSELKYTPEQVSHMHKAIRAAKLKQGTEVTFAIRAAFVHASADELRELLRHANEVATLTIWGGKTDTVDGAKVAKFIKTIGTDRTYLDVPEELYKVIQENL